MSYVFVAVAVAAVALFLVEPGAFRTKAIAAGEGEVENDFEEDFEE